MMWFWLKRLGTIAAVIPHMGYNKEAMSTRLIGGNVKSEEVGVM